MSVNVSEKGNIDFTKGSIIRNLILIPFYLVMVVLRQLFLASDGVHAYDPVRGQIREKITAEKPPE